MPTGFFAGGVDYHTYIAKMKWFGEGHSAYVNLFTGEDTEPVRIYQFYQFLGNVAGLTGLPLPWVYHLARSFLGALSVVLMYRFMKNYSGAEPVPATLFAVLACGGYLTTIDGLFGTSFGADGTDYFLQGRVWLALLTFPHYMMDILGILLLLEAYLCKKHLLASAGGFLMSLGHPFLAALFMPVILIDGLLKKQPVSSLKTCAFYLAGLAPISIVVALDMRMEWVEIWRAQTYRETPHPLKFLLVGYGAVGVMGWYGAAVSFYRKKFNIWVIWLVLASVTAYIAHLPNKREFAFFISIPLGVLAAPVAEGICRWFLRVTSRRALGVAACVVFIYLCVWQVPLVYAQTLISFRPQDTYNGYYITGEYREVFNLINEERGVVLCPEWLGNLIPAYTGCRPYVGHLTETLHYSEKKRKLDAFFKGEMDFGEMKDFLAQNRIRWVIYDVHKKGYRQGPLRKLLGDPVFEGREVVIWQL